MDNYIKLNNGVKIPRVGLGVFRAENGPEASDAVKWALEAGYRHIDTAAVYGNEESVADGIKRSGVDRKDIFITTKLWCTDIDRGSEMQALEKSLKKLETDYVDLYLIHWPVEKSKNIASWHAMERMLAEGKVRAIGVSNFIEKQLDELLAEADVVPAVNQIEIHPDYVEKSLTKYCASKNICVESYSPLGGHGSGLMSNETIKALAEKYGRTPAQIIIRWHMQRDIIVIPKSVHKDRIISNFDVFDFELASEDVDKITALDAGNRSGGDPETFGQMVISMKKK